MRVQPWHSKRNKRAVRTDTLRIPVIDSRHLDASKLEFIAATEKAVSGIRWPYKSPDAETLQLRDQALAYTIFLSGLRITEILGRKEHMASWTHKGITKTRVVEAREGLKKKAFHEYPDQLFLTNIVPLKHGLIRQLIIFPTQGPLENIGKTIQKWLTMIPSEEAYAFPSYLFDHFTWEHAMTRTRAWTIMRETINAFPHWFRGLAETYLARAVFRDPYRLKSYMGLKRLDSTSPYVEADWEASRENLFH